MIELHSSPTPNGQKVMIMLEETGLPWKHFDINIRLGDQLKSEYLKLSPNNKIPAIVDPDGPDGKPVSVAPPQIVELTVVETEPGIKSATASSVTKPAKLETGLVVQVPPFINEGEKIRVDTSEGTYLSRA